MRWQPLMPPKTITPWAQAPLHHGDWLKQASAGDMEAFISVGFGVGSWF